MTEAELKIFAAKEAVKKEKTTEPQLLAAEMQTALDRANSTTPVKTNELAQRETARMAEKLVALLARDFGSRYAPNEVSLSKYAIYDPRQQAAIDAVKAFKTAATERLRAGDGVILYGTVGTGKDHLLANLLYTAATAGFSARWFNCQRLYGQLRDRIGANQREQDLIQMLTEPAVIGLSDPIAANDDLNNWRMEFLYRVIDTRYCSRKPTFMTLNAKTPEDADAKLGQQVFDRLQESAVLVPCFWQSFRERKRA